jgi:UDP-N-acetylmuramate--alanine ligase
LNINSPDLDSSFLAKRPLKLHLVGIGGIGMSALAQLLVHIGADVSGSDRALSDPANTRILNPLSASGIKLFPQDGSYLEAVAPDALVFSSAIESDNPDFRVAGESIPFVHRADMLSAALNSLQDRTAIAVAGSCGKTTVTAWLAETLVNLGYDPLMVGGGLSNSFVSASLAGNFRPGGGRHVVFEADESDKSLLEYSPDYALILNIGLDHYSKTELIGLFTEFLSKVGKGCVLSKEVRDMLGESAVEHLRVAVFDSEPSKGAVSASGGEESRWTLDSYSTKSTVLSRCFGGDVLGGKSEPFTFSMPSPGRHTAANAMAVLAMIDMLETEPAPSSSVDKGDAPVEIKKNNLSPLLDGDSSFRLDSSISEGASLADSGVYRNWSLFGAAVSSFAGVWRRFDLLGYDSNGAEVRDDYAHNVDKIVSVIKTAKETADRVFVVFQPHGFKPLEFMRGELFEQLEIALSENDEFAFLPVFYAGGTAAFKPTSEEVCADFNRAGTKKYNFFANREDVVCYLEMNTLQNDMVLVLGARDNSLSEFASKIACKKINS